MEYVGGKGAGRGLGAVYRVEATLAHMPIMVGCSFRAFLALKHVIVIVSVPYL
jgi:hypothetical protein